MKVKRLEFVGGREGDCEMGGGTVVVGVKLDSQSRELLTWALVKVAESGDRVVALHVLHNAELLDRNGNSALLSLVKAFESILNVYEGFCNLKQIDLKLKICRGPSVRKVLAEEAKSFKATKLVVGIKRNNHTIGSSTSIAKYCAKKLPPYCWVLAADNGKVMFRKEATNPIISSVEGRKSVDKLFDAFHRTLSKNFKVPNRIDSRKQLTWEDRDVKSTNNLEAHRHSWAGPSHSGSGCRVLDLLHKPTAHNCSTCDSRSMQLKEASSRKSAEEASNDWALVPVENLEGASSSVSVVMPEMKPGWPLLRRMFLPNWQSLEKTKAKKISVVQWAMQLPFRKSTSVHPDNKTANRCEHSLDGESGAIVPVGDAVSPDSDESGLKKLPKEFEHLYEKYASSCRLFSYHELLSATSNFSTENMIGKGGNSQVYKGRLSDGKELAVKILKPSEDALKEFSLEVEIITALNHRNIISLFGFCCEENKLLLVYDLIARGSLEENLHCKKSSDALSWDNRYKVAVSVAEALDYLHNSNQPVIHRDVKSSNILLADDFEPQLSDFGLATWASASPTHITCSDVTGTFGYLAPEYFMYGKVHDKVDVYAFGVVLLELLSGRKPISNEYPKGQESVVMWGKPILQSGKFAMLLDPSLVNKYDKNQVERLAMAASLCIRRSPRLRPRMSHILKLLQGDEEVTKWARLQVSASEEHYGPDDEEYPASNLQSHLNLALLDVDDDSISVSSTEPTPSYLTANKSIEDYLQGRWTHSSSFD